MIRNEQVVLKLKVNNDFIVEQINFIRTQWLRFDIYIGHPLSQLLGNEQTNELIKHLKKKFDRRTNHCSAPAPAILAPSYAH